MLVVGPARWTERSESAVAMLEQLGCEVVSADLWDDLGAIGKAPPMAIFIEAIDSMAAARAALTRCRAVSGLQNVPALVGASVSALSGLRPEDGFDDFVLHPYVDHELYLRVRRAEWRRADFHSDEQIKIGPLHIDLAAHEVQVHGRSVELTHQEFALLSFFCQRRGRVFSRDQLLEQVWGVDYYGGSRTVDIHVRRIRQKLGDEVADIETVRGVGYKMRAPS